MGNCQAVDAAAVVIQHPGGGKVEKLYCPITASQVMKTHPGHYVALLLSTTLYPPPPLSVSGTVSGGGGGAPVKLTRIKLLRPTDTLTLGRVYRLITNQEVMKGLWAKKQAKAKLTKSQYSETDHSGVQTTAHAQSSSTTRRRTSHQHLVQKSERDRRSNSSSGRGSGSSSSILSGGGGGGSGSGRSSRTWQPSLNSILETAGTTSTSTSAI